MALCAMLAVSSPGLAAGNDPESLIARARTLLSQASEALRNAREDDTRLAALSRAVGAQEAALVKPLSHRSPKTEVRASPIHGKGLFAREPIAAGEIVAVKGGHVMTRVEWQELEAEVSREAAFQRGQLGNLAFHEPEVQQRMLALLPEPL